MVEAADIVIKAQERNWKESEYGVFQESSLEKATKVQQQISRPGIEDSAAATVATGCQSALNFHMINVSVFQYLKTNTHLSGCVL